MPPAIRNGLHMHSSNRLEELACLLADMLKGGAGADPFVPAQVVVQTPGVARWLSLRLADKLGCCMNVEYLFPRNFIDAATARMLGGRRPAHPDAERMAWRIFAVLPGLAAGEEVLARYLEDGVPLK
ncbi:MAG: exodeoxyribonuclease V subunit gamma, partial [Opitutales bacterium]